jgi:hypothetical protein
MNITDNQVLQAVSGLDPQMAAAYSATAFAAILGSLLAVFALFAGAVAIEKLCAHIKKGWISRKSR